jgi:hypothetical protein
VFRSVSSTTSESGLVSPPESPWRRRQLSTANAQSWSRWPPSPSGWSSDWFGPATKPSSDIEMSTLSLPIVPPSSAVAGSAPILVPRPREKTAASAGSHRQA